MQSPQYLTVLLSVNFYIQHTHYIIATQPSSKKMKTGRLSRQIKKPQTSASDYSIKTWLNVPWIETFSL